MADVVELQTALADLMAYVETTVDTVVASLLAKVASAGNVVDVAPEVAQVQGIKDSLLKAVQAASGVVAEVPAPTIPSTSSSSDPSGGVVGDSPAPTTPVPTDTGAGVGPGPGAPASSAP